MSYRYTVKAKFTKLSVAEEWLNWLRKGHCQEVLDGGAVNYEIVALDSEKQSYEVRYQFPDKERFESYEEEHAPRLRAEGLALFPVEKGIEYSRSTGEAIFGG